MRPKGRTEGHDMCLTPGCLGIVMLLSHVIIHRPPGCRHGLSSSAIHFKTTTSLLSTSITHITLS